jgi:hypothetical protein
LFLNSNPRKKLYLQERWSALSGSPKPDAGSPAFAQGSQDDDAADRKCHNGSKCGDQHDDCVEVKNVGEYRSHSEDDAQAVEPERTANGRDSEGRRKIGTETKLQEQRDHTDGGDHDQCHWTEERATAGIEDDQGKSSEQEAGGDESRLAGLRMRIGAGGLVRHGVPS